MSELIVESFNPRPREGGDVEPEGGSAEWIWFQSTPP